MKPRTLSIELILVIALPAAAVAASILTLLLAMRSPLQVTAPVDRFGHVAVEQPARHDPS